MNHLIKNIPLWILLLSCAVCAAQERANVLRVHRAKAVIQQPVSCLDSIAFPDSMVLHFTSGNRQSFLIEKVDSVTFAVVNETELHEAVDLGLSVLWATCNVGGQRPEDLGSRFAWGETVEKQSFTEDNYVFSKNGQFEYIGVNICSTKYDAARQRWGGQWRMPTRSEMAELTSRCTWTAETLNGVRGYRVRAANGNSIFLPAAGYQNGDAPTEVGEGGFYWSGSLNREMTSAAYNLNFRGYDADWSANRAYGFSVRAVR